MPRGRGHRAGPGHRGDNARGRGRDRGRARARGPVISPSVHAPRRGPGRPGAGLGGRDRGPAVLGLFTGGTLAHEARLLLDSLARSPRNGRGGHTDTPPGPRPRRRRARDRPAAPDDRPVRARARILEPPPGIGVLLVDSSSAARRTRTRRAPRRAVRERRRTAARRDARSPSSPASSAAAGPAGPRRPDRDPRGGRRSRAAIERAGVPRRRAARTARARRDGLLPGRVTPDRLVERPTPRDQYRARGLRARARGRGRRGHPGRLAAARRRRECRGAAREAGRRRPRVLATGPRRQRKEPRSRVRPVRPARTRLCATNCSSPEASAPRGGMSTRRCTPSRRTRGRRARSNASPRGETLISSGGRLAGPRDRAAASRRPSRQRVVAAVSSAKPYQPWPC